MFPDKNKLLQNFLSCIDWEEKYLYLMKIGDLLINFPEKYRIEKFRINGCQSDTWIVCMRPDLLYPTSNGNFVPVEFYGYSESSIIKGIIVIIFSFYFNLNIQSILKSDAKSFLNQFELDKNLTISRNRGVQSILHAIQMQVLDLL